MDESPCIRVWTRPHVPEPYRRFATHFDDGEVENTAFVAHVPAAVPADRLLKQCVEVSDADGYICWESRSLFGANCVETIPDPGGDGVVVVGGWV